MVFLILQKSSQRGTYGWKKKMDKGAKDRMKKTVPSGEVTVLDLKNIGTVYLESNSPENFSNGFSDFRFPYIQLSSQAN